jgi:diadenosine tetraphosphate (Ap4A) HIT family hydrolase
VSPGHLLIVSNIVRKDYFDLSGSEKFELIYTIDKAKEIIEKTYKPDGYNIGMNCGYSAGQTIFHFHCHIIPRYNGDMVNPKGGVRHCIDGKGYYNEI